MSHKMMGGHCGQVSLDLRPGLPRRSQSLSKGQVELTERRWKREGGKWGWDRPGPGVYADGAK